MPPTHNRRRRKFRLEISPEGISLSAPKPSRRWVILALCILFALLVIILVIANHGTRSWAWDIVLALIQAFTGSLLSSEK